MIQIENLYKKFDENIVLQNISFSLKNTGITAIMAKSGSGKTTLINIILNLTKQDSGNIKNLPPKISVVFQENRLLNWLSPIKNLQITTNKNLDEIKAILKKFDINSNQTIDKLSGGMKRRVAIARALLLDYDFLILDEPFKEIDMQNKIIIMNEIKKIAQKKPILFITHNINEIEFFNLKKIENINQFDIYK